MLSKVIIGGKKEEIAHELKNKGYSQEKISKLLNITQPMVHKYLKKQVNISEKTKRIVSKKLFNQTIIFSKKPIEKGEYYITVEKNILTSEKLEAVKELKDAIELLKGKDIKKIIPKVKLNFAYALEKTNTNEDILALPSGLLQINNGLHYSEPEFGSSNHLSNMLLFARRFNKNLRAVMNIKYSRDLDLKKFKTEHLDDKYNLKTNRNFDILVHEGSFGIEPSTYIFGKTPEEVTKKVLQLL